MIDFHDESSCLQLTWRFHSEKWAGFPINFLLSKLTISRNYTLYFFVIDVNRKRLCCPRLYTSLGRRACCRMTGRKWSTGRRIAARISSRRFDADRDDSRGDALFLSSQTYELHLQRWMKHYCYYKTFGVFFEKNKIRDFWRAKWTKKEQRPTLRILSRRNCFLRLLKKKYKKKEK